MDSGIDHRADPKKGFSDHGYIEFTRRGTWQGTDGCNRLAGTYTLDDRGFHADGHDRLLLAADGGVLAMYTRAP